MMWVRWRLDGKESRWHRHDTTVRLKCKATTPPWWLCSEFTVRVAAPEKSLRCRSCEAAVAPALRVVKPPQPKKYNPRLKIAKPEEAAK